MAAIGATEKTRRARRLNAFTHCAVHVQQTTAIGAHERAAVGAKNQVARYRVMGACGDPAGIFALLGAAIQFQRGESIGGAA